MKVSVVIPAYNEEKFIRKALKSVTNQLVDADEIIVVNNNSSDKTVEITRSFSVRIIDEKKQGMISARNTGFDNAKYDIIARIDADVQVPPDWIQRIKRNFEKKKIDALTGPLLLSDLKLVSKSILPSHIYLESLRAISKGNRYLIGPQMSLTNDIWKKVRDIVSLDDKKVHEDLDLSLKITKVGGIIGYDRKLIVKGSARRMKKHPESFFLEYPVRVVKTFIENKDTFKAISKRSTKKAQKLIFL